MIQLLTTQQVLILVVETWEFSTMPTHLSNLKPPFIQGCISSLYSGITASEQAYLTDIRDHEVAHRNFFKAAITAAGATPIIDLEVDFSSIDFGNRTSVLSTAKAFEDLGVTAYNGAGKLITTPAYLVVAGKIVSVEARHAALIADLIANGTFADTTDAMALMPHVLRHRFLPSQTPTSLHRSTQVIYQPLKFNHYEFTKYNFRN